MSCWRPSALFISFAHTLPSVSLLIVLVCELFLLDYSNREVVRRCCILPLPKAVLTYADLVLELELLVLPQPDLTFDASLILILER